MSDDAATLGGGAVGSGLSPEGAGLLQKELTPGERVVWAGHPAAGVYARGAWLMSVFGIFFIGFSLLWFVMTGAGAAAASSVHPAGTAFAIMPACGLVPLGVGVFALTAPLWMRGQAGRLVYAVTDRRALVITPTLFGSVSARSFSPAQLGSMERFERKDGTGDLVFDRELWSTGSNDSRQRRVGFLGLADVKSVEVLVRAMVDAHSAQGVKGQP